MKLFKCQACGQVLHFENRVCERCGHVLGFAPEDGTLSALEPRDTGWEALALPGRKYRFCENASHEVCNWLVDASSDERFCAACRHNAVVPDLSDTANLHAWQLIEFAKHRLFYGLLKLGLPLATRIEDPEHGLVFEFLADPPEESGPKVMTGHDNGLITLSLAEADTSERERRRHNMGEAYRTLLGHFRHEIGHHYWDLLVRDGGQLDACRRVFGDDREDYEDALARHYREGPPADWRENFVSAYATTHPWEDFAETWAHYLHIVDTLEMAGSVGLSLDPQVDDTGALKVQAEIDPCEARTIEEIVTLWLPIAMAMNSINRCMGQPDLYPFVLAPGVIAKLGFIHDLVRQARAGSSG